MREIIRRKPRAVGTGVLSGVLVVTLGIVTSSGFTQPGFGLSPGDQDPAVPPSPPSVSLNPDHLDFGKQVTRSTSVAKRIIVKNSGGKPLYFDSVDIGGDNPTAFAILKDTCTGVTVDPNKACIVDITFTPYKTGERNARLRLNDNALDSPQKLRLKGTGINSNDVAPF